MKYAVFVGSQEVDVEITGEEILVGGKVVDVRLDALPQGPMRDLVMDGATTRMAVGYEQGHWIIQVDGRSWSVEVVDERTQQIRAMARGGSARDGAGLVKAPMPGLVLRWQVEEGQSVQSGSALVVLEAMKMENQIRASGGGVVRRILVQSGTAVEKGTPLLEIGPAS
jgi:biotin carboxyl carrier protein